jgi:transposase
MSDLFWLTDAQMARLEPFFPKSHGKPRVDDRRVATRYDRCPKVFLLAIALAALVIYWL